MPPVKPSCPCTEQRELSRFRPVPQFGQQRRRCRAMATLKKACLECCKWSVTYSVVKPQYGWPGQCVVLGRKQLRGSLTLGLPLQSTAEVC